MIDTIWYHVISINVRPNKYKHLMSKLVFMHCMQYMYLCNITNCNIFCVDIIIYVHFIYFSLWQSTRGNDG